jgi:amidase
LNELTACQALALLAKAEIRSEDLVRACLERVQAREPQVSAWAHIDSDQALAQARVCDAARGQGPLQGLPIAIKDVIDTADMPTQMGSDLYKGYRPAADASVVALLRAAGAVILGKTATAEFAGVTPCATRNPHNLAHTPGGSSSGSGAAVADFMVPVAFGTQTGGSVQRPASYCGVVGFKPTYGRINRAGLKFAAESLDTLGWMARSVDDIALVDTVLRAEPVTPLVPVKPERVALCRTPMWAAALPETHAAVEYAAAALAEEGVAVEILELPAEFALLKETREVLNDYERARALAHEWNTRRAAISPQLSRSMARGYELSHDAYMQAQRHAENMRRHFDTLMAAYDVVLAPCVHGEAPEGLAHTGDAAFQSLWTLLHVPTLGLPTHRGPRRLPVSIQLVGMRHGDRALLQAGSWIWNILGRPA